MNARALTHVRRALAEAPLGAGPVLDEELLRSLAAGLGAIWCHNVEFAHLPGRWDFRRFEGSLPDAATLFRRRMFALPADQRPLAFADDPSRPEPYQSNRPVTVPELTARMGRVVRERIGVRDWIPAAGFNPDHYIRLMVCHGGVALASVGSFHQYALDSATLRAFGSLRRLLHDRFARARELEAAGWSHRAVEMVLELLERPTLLVSDRGRVLLANREGRARFDADADQTTRRVRESLAGRGPYPSVRISVHGKVQHLVQLPAPPRPHGAVERFVAQHQLRGEAVDALRLLAGGASNKEIAHELGCSLRKVEYLVAKLVALAQVESRASLVAQIARSSTSAPPSPQPDA